MEFDEEYWIELIKEEYGYFRNCPVQTDAICLAAIKQEWYMFRYVTDPSDELKLAAINQHEYAIQFIDNPSDELIELAFENTTVPDRLIQHLNANNIIVPLHLRLAHDRIQ